MKKVISIFISIALTFHLGAFKSYANNAPGFNLTNIGNEIFNKFNLSWLSKQKIKPYLNRLDKATKLSEIIKDNSTKIAAEKDLVDFLVNEASYNKGAGNKIWSFFKGISNFLSNHLFISFMLWSHVCQKVNDMYQQYKTKLEVGKVEKPTDPLSTIRVLDELMSSVKGQEKVKKQLRRIILNIVDRNAQYMASPNKKSKRVGPGATIIYMVGPSGVGKSFTADVIRKVLNGSSAEPFFIEASDIDRASDVTATEQLFGMRKLKSEYGEINECSPFITRIKAIPNTVVVINEYDKMHTPELDEKLRTMVDQGYINVNGEKIDCSAVTFIITSNESAGSVRKGNTEVDNTDDGTGSRTFIKHDKSFLNRVKVLEFENLSEEDYEEIAQNPFYNLVERYKHQYKISVDLNGTIHEVASQVARQNKGARPIFDYIEKLNDKLLNEVVFNSLDHNGESIKYKVLFDNDHDDFILKNLDKHHEEAE